MSDPALVVCAHGTRNRSGAAVVDALVAEVADRRPALTVRAAYLDVQQPDLATVLTGLGDAPTVVVPLLLSAGFHVHVDIRRELMNLDTWFCTTMKPKRFRRILRY